MVGADFVLPKRLFRNFAFREENPFCPRDEFFFWNLKISGSTMKLIRRINGISKKSSRKHCGASAFIDLNPMTCDS